jgi:threonine dehydratase
MACRTPDKSALAIARRGVERVIQVTEDEVRGAMRAFFSDTHNVAEGAGAAALAALLQDREAVRGQTVAVVLTGANVDSHVFARVLGG